MDFLNIFEVIVISSLIGSLMVLMILSIKGIFKNKLSPTFHYYIWLILLIKLILPFGPQNPLNISNIYDKVYTQNLQVNSSKQLENTDLGSSTSISTSQTSNESVVSNVIKIPLKNSVNIEKVVCFIWMFGVLSLIGIVVLGHEKLRKIVRDSIKDISSTDKEILEKCIKAMNIKTKVEIVYSSKITSPSLCGVIKPKILIPNLQKCITR